MIITHPRTALLLQRVEERLREKSTLEQVLDNPAVKGYAREDALSQSQKGLVAATVSLMQDRLLAQLRDQANDLRKTLERERYMFAAIFQHAAVGLRQLYTTPVFSLPSQATQEPAADDPPKKKGLFGSVFTWGNIFAASALIAVAIALYFTKAYSSYKDRVDNQSQTIEELTGTITGLRAEKASSEQQTKSMMDESTRLNGEVELWRATANERERNIASLNQELQRQAGQVVDLLPLREQIKTLSSELQEAKARLAQLQAEARSQVEQRTIYKDLYDKENKRNGELLSGDTRLDKENNQLKREVEQVKSQNKKSK